ncbi:MAG: bifunctional riboflavin kinase/FAD synthetase [Candidatus Dadabacteria bacterium]|nr:bifunctional riboflavin kinase/FAD synthetase [Candidatus Dadabacteria bacterium]
MKFYETFPAGMKAAVALGNFDGVHRGHRKIISALKSKALEHGAQSCAVTFYPHPQKIVRDRSVRLLMPFGERLRLLEETGVDMAVKLEFTKELSLLSPERFIKEVMVDGAGMKAIVVGPRFGFGNRRRGDVEMLKTLGERFGFETVVIEPAMEGGGRVSSTAIREFVLGGRMEEASRMLGYRYHIRGVVAQGEKRGREIGFPTVNLQTDWEMLPKPGVYATLTAVEGAGSRPSISNVGSRPTFGGGATVIESHLLDTGGDFYGRQAVVEFVERVRDEKKFASGDELSRQIEKDIGRVRVILKNCGGGGGL